MTGLPGTVPAARPTPLPKRPKNRYVAGVFLFALMVGGSYSIWITFFQYQAYGIVTGRVIRVSSPWGGSVRAVFAREGDTVRQGQLLAILENHELQQQLARSQDELSIAEASVHAEVAKLRWQSQIRGDRSQKALAEYFELWGSLLQEQSKLSELKSQLVRTLPLYQRELATQERMEAIQFAEKGQRDKVEKLTIAVEEMKRRVEVSERPADDDMSQLKPQLLRIQAIQSEISRLRQQAEQENLIAPVNGRVVKRHLFTGEYAAAAQPIIEVLEEGSLEAVVYVSPRLAEELPVGRQLELMIEPHPQRILCTVTRVGDRLELPPKNIQRNYRRNESLVPVYARPETLATGELALRLGSMIKLPYGWSTGETFVPSDQSQKTVPEWTVRPPDGGPVDATREARRSDIDADNERSGRWRSPAMEAPAT